MAPTMDPEDYAFEEDLAFDQELELADIKEETEQTYAEAVALSM